MAAELELGELAERLWPAVPAFVRRHSAVFRAALEDDADASWVTALPPSSDDCSPERCLHLIGVLSALQAEELDPFRVFQLRSVPLFSSLSACSPVDMEQLQKLADYLQLPKALLIRIRQHCAARDIGAMAGRIGDAKFSYEPFGGVRAALETCEALSSLLQQGVSFAVSTLERTGGRVTDKSHFAAGLCGDSTHGIDWNLEGGTGFSASRLSGLVAAGHSLPAAAIEAAVALGCAIPTVAACFGNLHALQALWTAGAPLDDGVGVSAASGNRVNVLQWLAAATHVELGPQTTLTAAGAGSLEALQWLVTHGSPLHPRAGVRAAGAGHMSCLRWLFEQGHFVQADGTPLPELGAPPARRGDLATLQALQESGMRWTAGVLAEAVAAGQLPVVQWLRARACPWTESACREAATFRRWEVLRWLRAQEPPCPWSSAVVLAAQDAHEEAMAQWALEHGCPEPSGADRDAWDAW